MAMHIEDSHMWPDYQLVIKELVTNKVLDIREPPWSDRNVVDASGKKYNPLATPLGYLAQPKSHGARVRIGLTVEEGNVTKGAVLRIGMGQYIYDPEIRIRGNLNDTLVTDDEVLRNFNHRMWNFARPRNPTPTPEPTPEPEDEAVAEAIVAPITDTGTDHVLVWAEQPEYVVEAVDASSVVIKRKDGAIIVANIVQVIGGAQ